MSLGEVLFEFRQIGNVVKVSAIHVDTNTEICLVGAPSVGEYALKRAAIRKLTYVLGRQSLRTGG
jgi:hypothetical protein